MGRRLTIRGAAREQAILANFDFCHFLAVDRNRCREAVLEVVIGALRIQMSQKTKTTRHALGSQLCSLACKGRLTTSLILTPLIPSAIPMPFKPLLLVPTTLALLIVGYLLSGPYLDRRAIRQANEFCSLVSEGEAIQSLIAKAEKNTVSLEEWPPRPGGEQRFIVRFPGFLASVVHCEISVVHKKVQARFVEKELW